MVCPEKPMLSAYADGEADWFERGVVDLHLAVCARCRSSLRLTAMLKQASQSYPCAPMSAALRGELARMACVGSAGSPPAARRGFSGVAWTAIGLALLALLGWFDRLNSRGDLQMAELVSKHNRMALTQPLAPKEALWADAFEGDEENDPARDAGSEVF